MIKSLNRQVAIIRPKEPYRKWVNSLPASEEQEPCTMQDLSCDCTAILLPEFENDAESRQYLKSIFGKLFRIELESWCTDENYWPAKRSYSLFNEWFDIEFHTEALDFGKGAIEIENY